MVLKSAAPRVSSARVGKESGFLRIPEWLFVLF